MHSLRKRRKPTCCVVHLSMFCLSTSVLGCKTTTSGEASAGTGVPSKAHDQHGTRDPEKVGVLWDRMRQTLPGTWEARNSAGAIVVESYRVVSNDSALVETFTGSSGRETVTVYHPDRDGLMLTHYCGQGNQ